MVNIFKIELPKAKGRKALMLNVFIHFNIFDKTTDEEKTFINLLIKLSNLSEDDLIDLKKNDFNSFKEWCNIQKKWKDFLLTIPKNVSDGRLQVGEYIYNDFLILKVRVTKRFTDQNVELIYNKKI